jgi:hypothetical protein
MDYGKKLSSVIAVPTSSALLTIDTRDSYKFTNGFINTNYQNPYDIQIYKNESIFQGKITRLALQEVNMIYSIPNVNPYNNILYLSDGTNEQSVLLTIGFYTPQELAIVIQTKLNDPLNPIFNCNTWVVNYITEYATFEITNSGTIAPLPVLPAVPFKILPKLGQDKGQIKVAGESTVYTRTSTLAEMMGFNNVPDALSPTPSPPIIKTGWKSDVASMLYTTYIDVVSRTLTQNQKVRDVSTNSFTGSNLLARIYIGKNFQVLDTETTVYDPTATTITAIEKTNDTYNVKPFYINYQPSYVKQVRWNDSIYLSSLNIRLQDDKGNLLYDFERNLQGTSNGIALAGSNAYVQLNFLISEQDD